jgi:molybdate transport system permease protein
MNWGPLILTFELACTATVLLLLISLPLAYWLAHTKNASKPFIETLVSMPLILPPTVLGFYLLMAFSPSNAFGSILESWLGVKLVFSFEGLVIASVIYSLPFMVHPFISGFSSIPVNLLDASKTLGKSKMETFFRVILPNMKTSLISGIVLAFAHTIGEFGVVLMIGGNIPGVTKVASIAIYDEVESLDYGQANVYSFILFVLAFIILLVVNILNRQSIKAFWR